ncbi:tetratricopeptide repeat protein [Hyphomicrobium sp. LHD-15]|uniref:tetratricopeptide repeat protein n=1 Tax=Hyphomicrobium sp. LHD-15 TaxID=3072142 RepID=UPI00280DF955|nr:tetratricopeptide repeat protein [Hyphomicrobium sp. LHD-15]MDQ8699051.1 tetratricopeptide repeat protein [Hyphomicrobium sp. LHD-15]
MTRLASGTVRLLIASCVGAVLVSSPLLADGRTVSKDVGPSSALCDSLAKGTAAWMACVGQASTGMADEELFYAGYWLAKNGQYDKALGYLTLAQKKDERVLTYIGFATRKLGLVDEAMPIYERALALNPDYAVARAYLGEAFLTKGQPEQARIQLSEIARRCGATCAPYADLKGHIEDYEARASKG